jgi:hypothetical protein
MGGPGSGPHPGTGANQADRVANAKKGKIRVDARVQRYCEEHNEAMLAAALGSKRVGHNLPADIIIHDASGKPAHGLEVKTIISNKESRIKMDPPAIARKRMWSRKQKAPFHTIVLDDTHVFDAGGIGVHDESKRIIYYRRGVGSFRTKNMHICKDTNELKSLIDMPTRKLPSGAK